MAFENLTYEKIERKARTLFLDAVHNTPFQFSAYNSYWHYRFGKLFGRNKKTSEALNFIAQKPNYGAGIGHQLANWNAGYYFSGYYNCNFAHFPFSNQKWEQLLGFGENQPIAAAILKDSSYKKVKLPRFNSENKEHTTLIGRIIQSYSNKKTLFLLAQDQTYKRQCDTNISLSQKFFSAAARAEDKLIYTPGNFNIAIHIRRGDVAALKQAGNSLWEERWLNNDYYVTVLKSVLSAFSTCENIAVYLFSQGTKEDFAEFKQFSNMHYCLDINAYESFVHMARADVLISSKSSFSYKPALISKGIKICPADFWHAYPASPDFILADNKGNFDTRKLNAVLQYN